MFSRHYERTKGLINKCNLITGQSGLPQRELRQKAVVKIISKSFASISLFFPLL